MKRIVRQAKAAMPRWASLGVAAMMIWALAGAGYSGSGAMAAGRQQNSPNTPNATCPDGQCFTDVPASNTFFVFVNALYQDDIIGGYACGGPGEPCDADNRPYYRPNNSVTRAQMAKFVDNGRRNIADAVGLSLHMTDTSGISLVISSTTTDSIDVYNASGAEAIQAFCMQPNQNCWSLSSYAETGNRPAYFYGGLGVYAGGFDDGETGLAAEAQGADSYALMATSQQYRSTLVKRTDPTYYGLVVAKETGEPSTYNVANFENGIRVEGNLTVLGSKSGYVVDAMQNVSGEALETGDVVAIVGNSKPVLGSIPVVTVKKADKAYATGVVGIVDQVLYVPDDATKAAYDKQQADYRLALAARDNVDRTARAAGTKPDYSQIAMPQMTISDAQGTVHAVDGTTVPMGGYANVVTLGSYKGVKVDASFGPIHAGDLLVSSPHAGYAMKATDMSLAAVSNLGKALGDLETGTGVIPVMVTLR